tara:strand:+ start:2154 stop:2750 length:597 start_codon:yes stop_codon:yes gene_type:complete
MGDIDYKFREDELIREFTEYIDKTYGGHYGQGGLQSSEVIVDRGHGIGFFLGNVDKYNGRYGKKGEVTEHRKDLMKIIHYGFLALYEHDRVNSVEDSKPDMNTSYESPWGFDTKFGDAWGANVTFRGELYRGEPIDDDSIPSCSMQAEDRYKRWVGTDDGATGYENPVPPIQKRLNDATPDEWTAASQIHWQKQEKKT